MPIHSIFKYTRILLLLCAASVMLSAKALEPQFYAVSSRLASGNWAKIEVKETGMQLIPNSVLKSLGFSDPSKVNVYGYGGRMISEVLDGSIDDDLPILPSVQTPAGIVFFGHGTTGWNLSTSPLTVFSHTLNPYSDHSYYFISDSEPERASAPAISYNVGASAPITYFTERIAHEQDLIAPSNTGRLMLGEDFRSQNNRTFSFLLPGNTGNATVTTRFGAKTSSGTASLVFTANGKQLNSTTSDRINPASSTTFIVTTTSIKTVEAPGEKLDYNIKFTNTGAISTAALDYIEVEYPRELKLYNNELYFYLNPEEDSAVKVDGCSESTILWDVTNPTDVKRVEANYSGGSLSFNIPAGYHEFVAFNPEKISRNTTAAGKISNQDIHSMEAPEMVIISPEEYMSAAQRLIDLHAKTDGLKVIALTPQAIYNEFSSGVTELTAFRKMLKMWYDRAQGEDGKYPRYCLIMSRPTYDNKMVTPVVKNAGYPRVPIWQSPTGETESNSYSTDDYIGMLADNYLSLNMSTTPIHVAVGRMPVKSLAEANTAIDKLEKYLLNPNYGNWRNNVMIIADDQDNGVHLNQAENCFAALRGSGNGASFLYEKLYLDAYELVMTGTGPSYPDAKQRMLDKINEGVLYIDYIGHANPSAWGHEGLLTWTDIISMNNTNLPFIYAATCEFLRWDDDAVSGAEELWLNPNAGVISMICPSRSVLITANGVLNKATSQFVFKRDSQGLGMRTGDIMIEGKNAGQSDVNKLKYGLIGDPSMRLPSPTLNVAVTKINGLTVPEETPVISARSSVKVEGVVTDVDGNIIEDFDGTLEILLFDAETVVTTNGNGEDGVVSEYNDRKTRLYSGRVKVNSGKWETTVMMPSEIENNYSPALFSLYAYDENGREANGYCEDFYVFGFNDNAPVDNDGPEIREFYLNNPSFTSGDVVSPSPVLTAKMSDISGINMSEAGIGHSMIITLDGKTHFNDVSLYYTADETDPCSGTIAYPLNDIKAGEHQLQLTVWDNANNSSTASLSFTVSATWKPDIDTLTTDVNPASTSVNFIIATNDAESGTKCLLEVFDLNGRKVWQREVNDMTLYGNNLSLGWDLCDFGNNRVARGIYLYRATVTTPKGAVITKSKKLAVTAK